MKHFIKRITLAIACTSSIDVTLADIEEITSSSASTQYCVQQTSVRGGFDNLVIDHNLIIPPADHFKTADVFIGARIKSDPDVLWLLSGTDWRKINSEEDLIRSQHQHFEELPLVIPVSVFYNPTDLSAVVGDGEIWIGYGLRSATETARDSFDEMSRNQRYNLLWEALPPPYIPVSGIRSPMASICLDTTTVTKKIHTVQIPPGPIKEGPDVSPGND